MAMTFIGKAYRVCCLHVINVIDDTFTAKLNQSSNKNVHLCSMVGVSLMHRYRNTKSNINGDGNKRAYIEIIQEMPGR